MTTMTKIIIGLVLLVLLAFGGNALVNKFQADSTAKIMELNRLLGEAQAREEENSKEAIRLQTEAITADARSKKWETTANAALARMAALEGRMKGIEAKLIALGPQKPVTDPAGLPEGAPAIAQEMTKAGVTAYAPEPDMVALKPHDAQIGLALIMDGKEYPKALERVELLTEKVGNLEGQKAEIQSALESQQKATTEAQASYATEVLATEAERAAKMAARDQVSVKDGIIGEKDKQLTAEKKKKFLWGAGGAVLTALILLL